MSVDTKDEKIDLMGKVAIVTGGGRGIGRAIALALAKAGARVAVAARSADQLAETVALIKEAGGHALANVTDVTDQQAVERMVAVTEKELGDIDLLVNNAGHPGPIGPLWEVDVDEWWRCMDVNFRGPFLFSRTVLPGMINRQEGRIINIASRAGTGPRPFFATYATSKCAIIRFSENLAAETKEHGIRVFAITPGIVRTAMVENAAASVEDEMYLNSLFRKVLDSGNHIPPEYAANLVLLLASGKADSLSGCCIHVHDDVEEMIQRADEIREKQLYKLRLGTYGTYSWYETVRS